MDENSKELEVIENSNLVIEPTGCTIEGDRTDSIEDHEIDHNKSTSTSSLTSRTSEETSKSSKSKIDDEEDEDATKDNVDGDGNGSGHETKTDQQQSPKSQNENDEQCQESIQSTQLSEINEIIKTKHQNEIEKSSNLEEEQTDFQESLTPEIKQNNELIDEISQKLNIKSNHSNELDENKTETFENSENLSQFISEKQINENIQSYSDENVSNNIINTTADISNSSSKDIKSNTFQYIYDEQKPFIYSSKQPPANSLVPAIISELKQKLEYSSSNNQDDDKYVEYDEQKSHLVYDHVTSMNSQTHDKIMNAENQMKTFTYHETMATTTTTTSSTDNIHSFNKINDNYVSDKEHKFDFSSKEQPPRRLPAFYKPRPQTITTIGPQVILHPTTGSHPPTNSQSNVKLNAIQNAPTYISPNRFYPQSHVSTSPTRKTTTNNNNNIHIGSEIISIESGPSITIYLRRPNSERNWGFNFYGGAEYGCPPFVNKITNNGLAHVSGVEVGDVIVSICGSLTVGKTFGQIKAEILRAGNELDLILIRRGVDLNQLSRVAPHVLVNTSSTPTTNRQFSFENEDTTKRSGTRSLTRGRSFRPVQTKSLRMLEEQLNAAENQMSVPKLKQNYQTSRDINVTGLKSSFTPAYGQIKSQVYIDNQSKPYTTQSTSKIIYPSTHHTYSKSVQYTTGSDQFPSQPPHNWSTHSVDQHNIHWVEATPSTNYNYATDLNRNYMMNSYSENNDSISSRSVPVYQVTSQNLYRSQYERSSEM